MASSSSKSNETQAAKQTAARKRPAKPQVQAQAPALAAPMVQLALADPAHTPPDVLLQLQRQAGNQAMSRLIDQQTRPQSAAPGPLPATPSIDAPAAPRRVTRSIAPPGIHSAPKLQAKPKPASAGAGFVELAEDVSGLPDLVGLLAWADGLVPPAAPPPEPPPGPAKRRSHNKAHIKLTPGSGAPGAA
jgi:hypothetical protein